MKIRLLGFAMLLGVARVTCAQEQPWTAKWIQAPWTTERDGAELDGSKPMPVFRRVFYVGSGLKSVELRIAGLGQWQARIDGKDVSPSGGLHEAWTDYRKTVAWSKVDLTSMFVPVRAVPRAPVRRVATSGPSDTDQPAGPPSKDAPHVLVVMLGNGMYNVQRTKGRYTKFDGSFGSPKLSAQLRLTFNDGRVTTLDTDEHWRVTKGPVTFSSIYGGEDYDARLAQSDWDKPAFDDAGWSDATVADAPGGVMREALAPDVVDTTHELMGVKQYVGLNKVVYWADQNIAGRPWIRVRGPAGAVLKITPGELLNPDGSVSQASSGGPMWWTYTLKGGGEPEEWEPAFGYYGFRYLQLEWSGTAMTPAKDGLAAAKIPTGRVLDLEARQISSASKQTGTFESSDKTLSAIHKLIVEAMHNNEVSLFTDCPHREKLGWLEETHLVAAGLMFNNDLRGLYAATDQNIADAQHDEGDVPTIAPQYTKFGPKYAIYDDSPEWGSAAVLAPWAAYRFYGDRKQLERDYPVMQRYVAYLQGRAQDGIVAYGLGDWYDIGPGDPGFSKLTTLGVTGTLMLYEDAAAMEKIAWELGRNDDAAKYRKLATSEATAFNAKYFDATKGYYDTGSQTAQAMPLALGIVPETAKAKVLEHLIADIHAHSDHTTAGEVGFPYLLRALMESGHNDVVLAMLLRKDPPSYGAQLAAGATALTEAWDANPKSSQDHFMLGAAEEWFYRGLGGIDVDMTRRWDQRITIRPELVAGVDWVKTTYDSVLGLVTVVWQREQDGAVAVTLTLPVEATFIGSAGTMTLPKGMTRIVEPGPKN